MKYISLAKDAIHDLPFYLAMEEYVAKCLDIGEAFFMWQIKPTVIFGRNQLAEKEVNLNYCRTHGIATYRRKSGGGCVYADMGNIMFSYITNTYNVADAYKQYLTKVVSALRDFGVHAEFTGRNDILVEGHKISGNAFYHVNGKSVVHGTMLFDTNMENMINAITPSSVKLTSNSVASVRSRITTLKKYLNITQEDFKKQITEKLCDGEYVLFESDERIIEQMSEVYKSDTFIKGKNPQCNIEKSEHIEGIGEFNVLLEISNGKIKDINLIGDYFLLQEIDTMLLNKLKGVFYDEKSVSETIAHVKVGDFIMNMTNEQFVKLIII